MRAPRFLHWFRRPAAAAAETAFVAEPRLPLHVLAEDAELCIREGRLAVETAEGCEDFALEDLSQVALHGGARVSIPALHALARARVPLVLHARSGWYLGQMIDLSQTLAATRRAQYRAADDPARRLEIARWVVEAKIAATARLARRRLGAGAEAVARIDRAASEAARCRDLARLRGIEGAAAAAWYGAFPQMLRAEDGPFAFAGRTRRPPRDGVNALLS